MSQRLLRSQKVLRASGLLTHVKSFCPLHKSSATGVARPLECLVMFHIFNADGGTVIPLGLASFKIVVP